MSAPDVRADVPGPDAFGNLGHKLGQDAAIASPAAIEARQAFLLRLSDRLRTLADPEAICVEMARLLGEYLQADRVGFAKARGSRAMTLAPSYTNGVEKIETAPNHPVDGLDRLAEDYGIDRRAFEAGQHVIRADVANDPALSDAQKARYAAAQVGANVIAPLSLAGRYVGALFVHYRVPHAWTREEIALIDDVTERGWHAMERARTEAALRESERRLARELAGAKALQAISGRLLSETAPEALYAQILDAATELMGADAASIQLLEADGSSLKLVAWKGFHPQSAAFWARVDAGSHSTCGQALRRRERVIAADVRAVDWIAGSDDGAEFARSGLCAVQSTPLTSRSGRPVGMISTHWRAPQALQQENFRLFDVLARQVADLIERSLAEEALRQSEEQFRTVANLVPEMLWSNDATGYTDWYNQRWFDYTGQTADEARGFGWLAAIHPADRPASLAAWKAAAESGRPLQQEHRLRAANGSYRWFLARAEPIRDASGTIRRWLGAAADVHQQRTAREELKTQVQSATAKLRQLSRRLVTVQEEERRHLARELHDEIGQALTGLQLQLAIAGRADKRHESLAEAEAIVRELTERVRELSLDLRPAALDALGLLPALLSHVERYQARTGLRIDVRHEGVGRRFDAAVEIAAYRVVQEALTNVVRHANASAATVHLLADDETLTLAVRDNGRGFDQRYSSGTGGLQGMRERVELLGGSVAIEAAPGGGTLVTAELPLDGRAADAGAEDGA